MTIDVGKLRIRHAVAIMNTEVGACLSQSLGEIERLRGQLARVKKRLGEATRTRDSYRVSCVSMRRAFSEYARRLAWKSDTPRDEIGRPSGYWMPVFSEKTGMGRLPLSIDDCVFSVSEFRTEVLCGNLVDFDGFGYPVKDGLADPTIDIMPSKLDSIPSEATHIVWYNK